MNAEHFGKIILVGAGPGDPGLLTLKGQKALASADLIVYDRLANSDLLIHAKKNAELLYVGKEPTASGDSQLSINQAMIQAAKSGKNVVRLKGGDPFVFGRGGEELQVIFESGINAEVIPGITSAIAAPAYTGIPVTHRGLATSFTVVSGSEEANKKESALDWEKLAGIPGTLVLLMGLRKIKQITEQLVTYGKPSNTPISVTQWGTLDKQMAIFGDLSNIAEKVKKSGISSPAVIVVGPVVEMAKKISWYKQGPLQGKNILVTRSRNQASLLSQSLNELGANALELATIEVEEISKNKQLESSLENIGSYSWIIFTSANTVDSVFNFVHKLEMDSRIFKGVNVAAIGPSTASRLRNYGINADFIPKIFTVDSMAQAFKKMNIKNLRILLPQSDIAPNALRNSLAESGAMVDSIVTYKTIIPKEERVSASTIITSGNLDMVTFTSSSTVTNLKAMLDGNLALIKGMKIASIGPVTSQTIRELGLEVTVEAKESTIPGLVSAILNNFSRK